MRPANQPINRAIDRQGLNHQLGQHKEIQVGGELRQQQFLLRQNGRTHPAAAGTPVPALPGLRGKEDTSVADQRETHFFAIGRPPHPRLTLAILKDKTYEPDKPVQDHHCL